MDSKILVNYGFTIGIYEEGKRIGSKCEAKYRNGGMDLMKQYDMKSEQCEENQNWVPNLKSRFLKASRSCMLWCSHNCLEGVALGINPRLLTIVTTNQKGV